MLCFHDSRGIAIVLRLGGGHSDRFRNPRCVVDDSSLVNLKLTSSRAAFASISMGAVGECNVSFIDGLKILAVRIALQHLHDWGLELVVAEQKRSRGMTPEMMQQMQSSQEVWSAGQIHEATKTSDAKDLFTASAGEPVKAADEFQVFETELLLKLLDFVFALGIVILC